MVQEIVEEQLSLKGLSKVIYGLPSLSGYEKISFKLPNVIRKLHPTGRKKSVNWDPIFVQYKHSTQPNFAVEKAE